MQPEHLAIVLLGLVVGFALGWWLRRRKTPDATAPVAASPEVAVAETPRQDTPVESKARKAALAALAALDALDTPVGRERGLQLASIARRFLTDAYAIPAVSCSTAELNELLRRHDLIDDDWRGVLDALDAVRFGGPAAIRDLEKHLRAVIAR